MRIFEISRKWVGIAIVSINGFGGGIYASPGEVNPSPILNEGKLTTQFYRLPLSFEKNEGQTDERVKYLARGKGYSLYLTPQEIVLALQNSALKMQFLNTHQDFELIGDEELTAKSNYFIGNDPQKWHANVPNYAKVVYKELYPGINVVFYGNAQQLEYDICIAPGQSIDNVRFSIEGANQLKLYQDGALHIIMHDEQEVTMQKPFIYQMNGEDKYPIDGSYALVAQNEIGFALGKYDKNKLLVIDPVVLTYSTYLGGSSVDNGYASALDSQGSAYVTGRTNSNDFPCSPGAYQTSLGANGAQNVFITKINPDGTGLVYSTYLGGSAVDNGFGIAVDSQGSAYVTGQTNSNDFPCSTGAYQTSLGADGAHNVFITKINPDGTGLVYSTYLGGSASDFGYGIAIDNQGSAYVTGHTNSNDFPCSPGAYQTSLGANGAQNVFIAKMNSEGTGLMYSTYLGGTSQDYGSAIALDTQENAYVTGNTYSSDFPCSTGAYQTSLGANGAQNVFITKMNSDGTGLVYSTYLGGTGTDYGCAIALDTQGNAYLTGYTYSSDFPCSTGAYQTSLGANGAQNAFITKMNSEGTDLMYSTYLGGEASDYGKAIALDDQGNAYVTGFTYSQDFPTKAAVQASLHGNPNAFLSKMNPAGTALVYSTYLGGASSDFGNGIAVDNDGNAFVIGDTTSADFPCFPLPGAYQTSLKGSSNVFISKCGFKEGSVVGGFQKTNRFATQSDLYNTIYWNASTSNNLVSYHIYRNGVPIGSVPVNATLQFLDHNRKKGVIDAYTVVSIDSNGLEAIIGVISLPE